MLSQKRDPRVSMPSAVRPARMVVAGRRGRLLTEESMSMARGARMLAVLWKPRAFSWSAKVTSRPRSGGQAVVGLFWRALRVFRVEVLRLRSAERKFRGA